ncbi:MAG: hypothetical protein QOG46_2485 [Pseudonocardiales bacterium]|nr:hypothetical protein [Pseudonocardiales bacterium]
MQTFSAVRLRLATPILVALAVAATGCSSDAKPSAQSSSSAASTASSSAGYLGRFTSLPNLIEAVRAEVAGPSQNGSGGGLHLCRVVANVVYATTAVLDGDRVVVVVFGVPGKQQVSVDRAASCDPVTTEPL